MVFLHYLTSFSDIIKMTALYTAQRGRPFLTALAMNEARNYEFDFLRPTHSLFGFFNALVEQYKKVLSPSKEMLQKLKEGSEEGARWKILATQRRYAEWERIEHEKVKKKQTDDEAERSMYIAIFPNIV